MKSIPAGLAVLGAGIAVASPLTSAGAQSPGPRRITLVEHNKGASSGFVDNPPAITRRWPALSPGDILTASMPLFDATNRTRRGRSHVHCTVTRGGTEKRADALCTGVFALGDGQISLVTVLHGNPEVISGIVTGGDGAYTGARGTFRSQNTRTGANDNITLLP